MSNDLQFVFRKMEHSKSSMTPSCREGHGLISLQHQETLLLFGGMSLQRENDNKKWKTQVTLGQVPTARCFMSVFYDPPLLGVFAGEGEQGLSMNDFYFLDTYSWIWKRLFVKSPPCPRHHCAVSQSRDKEQILFGGVSMPMNTFHNDTWLLDYSTTDLTSKLPDAQCVQVVTKGEPPAARQGHRTLLIGGLMIVIGGKTAVRKANTFQLYALNLQSYCWSTVNSIGCVPTSRSHFSISRLDSDNIVLFGGKNNFTNEYMNDLFVFNISQMFWENPYVAGKIPDSRYHHASCHHPIGNDENEILILGGLADGFLKMDIIQLSLARNVKNTDWVKIEEVEKKVEYCQEVADNTIYDYKKQLCDLEITILDEKRTITELKKKIQVQSEKNANESEGNEQLIEKLNGQIESTEEDNQNQVKHFETLFLMIKQEQLLGKEIKGRSKLLESTIQEIQQFMLALDQSLLAKPHLNEQLKVLSENSKAQILQERNNYKGSLNFLKNNYMNIQVSLDNAQNSIDKQKTNIISENQGYEKILMETEIDEQI